MAVIVVVAAVVVVAAMLMEMMFLATCCGGADCKSGVPSLPTLDMRGMNAYCAPSPCGCLLRACSHILALLRCSAMTLRFAARVSSECWQKNSGVKGTDSESV